MVSFIPPRILSEYLMREWFICCERVVASNQRTPDGCGVHP